MDRSKIQKKYGIIGESPALKQALDKVLQVAPTDITVQLNGETGVGKDVTARAIHDLSPRRAKNLVIVNCGAIPEGIIESELFGHEKGAYTGAHDTRMGYFEQADGGTIFLDEIVDTPMNIQVKLLRVLESGEFFRVGSSKLRKVNVRVIAASNKDMWKSVESGDFREDLYYRLNTVTIHIPPLRDRNQDILLIFHEFVSEFARKYDSVFRGMSDEARRLLLSYRWPGNIRELRNVAEQLVVLEKSRFVDEQVLRKYLKGRQKLGSADNLPMVFGQEENRDRSAEDLHGREMHLIYRALLGMRNDMGDMKKMLSTLFYHILRGEPFPKSLPAHTSSEHGSENMKGKETRDPYSEISVGDAPFSDVDVDEEEIEGGASPVDNPITGSEPVRQAETLPDDGNQALKSLSKDRTVQQPEASSYPPSENHSMYPSDGPSKHLTDDQRLALHLFKGEDLPSIEDIEKFLIARALEKYRGNRRKAARVLGMSERTLYRKMDQYEIS